MAQLEEMATLTCFIMEETKTVLYKTVVPHFPVTWTGIAAVVVATAATGGGGWFHACNLAPAHTQMKCCAHIHHLHGPVPIRLYADTSLWPRDWEPLL